LDPRAFYVVFIILFGLIAFGFGCTIALAAMSGRIEPEEPAGTPGSH